MNRIILYTLLLAGIGLAHCQHAKIRFPVSAPEITEPKECKPPVRNKKACDQAKEKQAQELQERASAKPPEHIIQQKYFLFGFYPKKIVIDAKQYCPGQIQEIHQYNTLVDGILEQGTFGIYMPRTMKITCAP
jgi:hypothetical protein